MSKCREVDIVRVDNNEIDGGVPTMDYFHWEMHKGRHFYFTETNTIASSGTREYLITTADTARRLHFTFSVDGKYITSVDLFKGTGKTAGTPITPINNDHDSTNASGATWTHTPTGTGDGTNVFTQAFGDGTNPLQASGGAINQNDEMILSRNTKYLLRITSGTNSNVVNTHLRWYEHTINLEKAT